LPLAPKGAFMRSLHSLRSVEMTKEEKSRDDRKKKTVEMTGKTSLPDSA